MKHVRYFAVVLSSILGSCMLTAENLAHARSTQEICDTPVFRAWKEQQAIRLWSPGDDTLSAERSGKVFTYNCFTLEDIDRFFSTHQDRIENAHFYPIIRNKHQQISSSDKDDDC